MLIAFHRATLSRFCALLMRRAPHGFTGSSAMASTDGHDDQKVVPKDEVIRFIEDCMRKAGTTSEDARVVGHHLMTADYRGHFSHGMNRMQMYVKEIENRITDPTARPQIVTDFQV